MSFKDKLKENEFRYFTEWRKLKNIIAKESKTLGHWISLANVKLETSIIDKHAWEYLLAINEARKAELDSILDFMNEAEEDI